MSTQRFQVVALCPQSPTPLPSLPVSLSPSILQKFPPAGPAAPRDAPALIAYRLLQALKDEKPLTGERVAGSWFINGEPSLFYLSSTQAMAMWEGAGEGRGGGGGNREPAAIFFPITYHKGPCRCFLTGVLADGWWPPGKTAWEKRANRAADARRPQRSITGLSRPGGAPAGDEHPRQHPAQPA